MAGRKSANSAQRIGSFDASLTKGNDLNDEKKNSTRTTGSSDMYPIRGNSGNSEEDTQGQRQCLSPNFFTARVAAVSQSAPIPKVSLPMTLTNDVESESSKRSRISMPPELHSTSLQTPTSNLDSSNDVNNQRIVPQETWDLVIRMVLSRKIFRPRRR